MIATDVEPKTRLWTRSEYHSMAEIGLFENQHVELIDGEVVVICPQNYSHTSSVAKAARVIDRAFGAVFWTRYEMAMRLSDQTEIVPDVSVVRGGEDDYDDHPTTAVLVVEVSGSSLKNDRTRKAACMPEPASLTIGSSIFGGVALKCIETQSKMSPGNFRTSLQEPLPATQSSRHC